MSNVQKQHLLTAEQMAFFAANGYIQLENLVPQELNEAAYAEQQTMQGSGYKYWFDSKIIREIFELPQVKGALQSFVGTNPTYDHSFLHVVKAMNLKGQDYHADSVIDTRPFAFDVQAFYFSHDTPAVMGPTLVLPGSHLRKVSNGSIGRYKNIVGQRKMESKAGTIAFLHHGIWHCAQPNHTDRTRFVFKLRLNPGQEQRALFNTDGYNSPEVMSIVQKALFPWAGETGRVNQINIAKFWRYLTGDDRVDASFEHVLTRMKL